MTPTRVCEFPRNLFHLADVTPSDPSTGWNTICITHRETLGGGYEMVLHVPAISFGPGHKDMPSLVAAAFDALRDD